MTPKTFRDGGTAMAGTVYLQSWAVCGPTEVIYRGSYDEIGC